MNHSGDAAEQIVRMTLDGVEVAARITGAAAKEVALLLLAALKNNSSKIKARGRERLVSMLRSGKPLEIFSVRERDLQTFTKGAKQYGIVYCVLRNMKNNPDGLCDILVKADDAPKISRLVERFRFATIDTAGIGSGIAAGRAEGAAQGPPAQETDVPGSSAADINPDGPDNGDIEKLLDELLGLDDGKAVPDSPEQTETESAKAAPTGTEPVKAEPPGPETERPANHPFSEESLTRPPQSELTSGSGKKLRKTISSKPSVRAEIRELTAQRKRKESVAVKNKERQAGSRPKTKKTKTTHRQPQRGKPKISKGAR